MGFWEKTLGPAPGQPAAFDPNMPGRPQYQPPAYQNPSQQAQGGPAPAPQAGPGQTQQAYQPPAPGDPYGHKDHLFEWAGNPKGGAGETASVGNCPNCDSPRFFSRRNSEGGGLTGGGVTTQNGVVYPAPECFECGYPRLQGVLASSMPAQAASGPVHAAQQGKAAVPPGSLATLSR